MTAVPRKMPQIIPTAAAYRGKSAPADGENSPLTKSGEMKAITQANMPPITDDASAPTTM
jgi:hypothetical protein